MSRVTPAEVKAIVETDLNDSIVQTWINGASSIVTANSTCMNDENSVLQQVELYLSAHFVAMLDPSTRGYITKDKLDKFETTYSSPMALNKIIDNTPYGTTANMISGGCLATINNRKATFLALGGC